MLKKRHECQGMDPWRKGLKRLRAYLVEVGVDPAQTDETTERWVDALLAEEVCGREDCREGLMEGELEPEQAEPMLLESMVAELALSSIQAREESWVGQRIDLTLKAALFIVPAVDSREHHAVWRGL
jgi:hypothetical protein